MPPETGNCFSMSIENMIIGKTYVTVRKTEYPNGYTETTFTYNLHGS